MTNLTTTNLTNSTATTYLIYDARDGFILHESVSNEELMNMVCKAADEYNYGRFRYWEEDGQRNYDCGPITYVAVAND